MRRLVVANLDAESSWSREASGGPPPRGLGGADEDRLAVLGLLLGILGASGDRLLLPRRPRARPGPWLASLGVAPLWDRSARRRRDEALCPWAWTEGLVARHGRGPEAPDPAVVRELNARSSAHEIGRRLGDPASGALLLHEEGELEGALEALGVGDDGAWVLRAPWAAAGRSRLKGRGRRLGEPDRRRLRRLLGLGGPLHLEPWRPRSLELGVVGSLDGEGRATLAGVHALGGVGGGPRRLRRVDAGALGETLRSVFEAVAAELRRAGFRGRFGIDVALEEPMRGPGPPALRRVADLNVRTTLGHLLHLWLAEARLRGRPDLDEMLIEPSPAPSAPGDVVLIEGDPGMPSVRLVRGAG